MQQVEFRLYSHFKVQCECPFNCTVEILLRYLLTHLHVTVQLDIAVLQIDDIDETDDVCLWQMSMLQVICCAEFILLLFVL